MSPHHGVAFVPFAAPTTITITITITITSSSTNHNHPPSILCLCPSLPFPSLCTRSLVFLPCGNLLAATNRCAPFRKFVSSFPLRSMRSENRGPKRKEDGENQLELRGMNQSPNSINLSQSTLGLEG
ncbi:hypothetical protein K440DRAFT_634531 [Wilcoxina mikolae CBS 423.85]|nr:hypothetical protein K440DRAFT_634531 [Wilcoxina mikolae CBS 423.85]